MGSYITNAGQKIENVHELDDCIGSNCCIHNPSDHHMRDWPMIMRVDGFSYGLMERICKHGVGHPDPDSAAYLDEHGPKGSRGTWGVHGCDGCCGAPND